MFKFILLTTLGLSALTAAANTARSEERTDTLREVVVTGQGTKPLQEHKVEMLGIDVPLKYLPVSVSRLDEKTLERKHIVNLEDAIKFLPGVIESSSQLGQFKRFSIRGSNEIAVAYDGVRDERAYSNNVPFGDLSGVESIEIIKGPAALLAGHSVMGGVINIVSKKPTDKFMADGRVSYGSWKQKDASIGFGGKLVGSVHYRAHAFTSNGDGYRMVNSNRLSALFALSSEIGTHGFWEAKISGADDSYTTDIGGAPTMPADVYYTGTDNLYLPSGSRNPMCDYEKVYNDIANNRMRRRLLEISTSYTHTFNEHFKIRERAFYSHSNLDYCCVEGMTYLTSTTPGNYKYQYTSRGKTYYTNLDSLVSGTPLNFNPDHKTFSNQLDFIGSLNTSFISHKFTVGWALTYFDFVQYNGYNKDDVWGPGMNEVISVDNPHYVRNWWDCKVSAANISRRFTNGFYIDDVLDFNDQWKGMIALRYDLYRYRRATAPTVDGKQEYNKEERTEWNKVGNGSLTYRAGVVYLPIPEISIYASAASFFSPYNTFYNKNYIYYDRNGKEFKPSMTGGEVYKPQTGEQFEFGVRYEHKFFDINASVFVINKRNVVTNLGKMPVEEDGETVEKTVQAQVGKYDSRGFDIDVTVHPWSTLNVTAGLGWSDYRRRASNMDWATGLPWFNYDESGSINLRATGVPRVTAYGYADYTVPSGALKSLSVHLSGRYTGKIYRDLTNNVYDSAKFIVDGGVYYTIKNQVTLSLLVNNLFDKHYFESATKLARPRNFMASVAYHFN